MAFLYGLLVLPLLVLEIPQVNAGHEPWDSPPDYPWWIPVVVMCPPERSEIPSQHQRFCEQRVARPPMFPVGGPVYPGKPPMFPVEPPMFPVGGPVNPGKPPMFPVEPPMFPLG
ncbi:merozoite surface protein CMZ-8-like, partial [Nothobranchius furzeri]